VTLETLEEEDKENDEGLEDLDFCKSRIYKKRKKSKRVSENRGDNL
jgi:hypothetical protein